MRSRRNQAPEPSPALAELLAKDGELDRILDGRGLTFEPAPSEPAPPPPPSFYIPPPDWDQEERERKQQERQQQQEERDRILQEELARIAADSELPESLPAKGVRGGKEDGP
jgi:hypothetical protein